MWLTPHAVVTRKVGKGMRYWKQLDDGEPYCFSFTPDDEEIIVVARSPEHLLEICDIALRLLVVSIVHSVKKWNYSDDALINAFTLAYLMEQCQSLKTLTLKDLEMDESHCRVLGNYSKPGLEISLVSCTSTSAGASALAEILGRNQGPTKLYACYIDNVVLADGLRGNSHLKFFTPLISRKLEVGSRELLAIARALRKNEGLAELALTSFGLRLNDEAWGTIIGSLKAHPTLAFASVVLKSQIQALIHNIVGVEQICAT
jgi:hypothetical protein